MQHLVRSLCLHHISSSHYSHGFVHFVHERVVQVVHWCNRMTFPTLAIKIDTKKQLRVSYVIISFKTATRGVALKNAWSVQPNCMMSSKNGNIQNLRKKWRDKNWINRIGLKRCCLSLSLFLAFSCSTCSQIQTIISGTWHQRSQHCMNHHEPICSNLSWKNKHLQSSVQHFPHGTNQDLAWIWAPLCGRAQESQFIGRSVSAIVVAIFIIQVVGIGPWHHHQCWGEQRRLQPTTDWWFWNPANSPIEPGSLSHEKIQVKHTFQVFFSPDFEPSTSRNDFRHHSLESSNRTNGR